MIAIFSESFTPDTCYMSSRGREHSRVIGDCTSCKLSWCRELASQTLLAQLPLVTRNATVTLVGVCYDYSPTANQPNLRQKKPSDKSNKVGAWMEPLFRFVVSALNTIFETEGEVTFHFTGGLTAEEEEKYELDDGYIGVLKDIPVKWIKSKAVTSFLMYLIRIWGNLGKDPLFPKIQKRGRYIEHSIVTTMLGRTASEYWLRQLSRYCLPFWFMKHGKGAFWTFLFTLHMGMKTPTKVHSFLVDLDQEQISGFDSFHRRMIVNPNAPTWFHRAAAHIASKGLTGLVKLVEEC